jgi:hypothetical protein
MMEDKPHATIGYEADLSDRDNARLWLHYRRNEEPVDYRVRLVTSTPHYGGLRWWFICPLVRNDGRPPRRVAKLYVPSGGKYFGSREGYGLTYTSCQESGKNGRLWRDLGAENWNRREDHATAYDGQRRMTAEKLACPRCQSRLDRAGADGAIASEL